MIRRIVNKIKRDGLIVSIKKVIRLIFHPSFATYKLAKEFIRYYEGFGYHFKSNGEERLLDKLSGQNISIVFDAGANVGDWSALALKKFRNAKVHAFELSESTYINTRLKFSTEERLVLNNCGLSDSVGEFEYKDYGENSGLNTLLIDANFHDHRLKAKVKKAQINTGSAYCKLMNINSIDLLKIDVEGAEHLVLLGFSELLEKGQIKVIQFEYGYSNGDANFLIKDFYKMLEGYGYVLGPLKPSGVIFMDFDYALNDFKSGPNYVAVHKSFKSILNAVKGNPILGFPTR